MTEPSWEEFMERADSLIKNGENLATLVSSYVQRGYKNLVQNIINHPFYYNHINIDEYIDRCLILNLDSDHYIKDLYDISIERVFIRAIKNLHTTVITYFLSDKSNLSQNFMDKFVFTEIFARESLISKITN